VKFRIEFQLASDGSATVLARRLTHGDFTLGPRPCLGTVRIQRYVTQPRALQPDGSPDPDLFAFVLVSPDDLSLLPTGSEVELSETIT
jgi:hypothetical protein